jgi:hypothetical protein
MAGSFSHWQRPLFQRLFGSLQVVTANRLGLNPALMAASNSSGGVMGKMISLQSICIAAAATQMGLPMRRGYFALRCATVSCWHP